MTGRPGFRSRRSIFKQTRCSLFAVKLQSRFVRPDLRVIMPSLQSRILNPLSNPNGCFIVQMDMAINIVEFDPVLHQKVRYNQQLYAVLLRDVDFDNLPSNAEVLIHFITHEKIMVRTVKGRLENFCVKKRELVAVEPHIIE